MSTPFAHTLRALERDRSPWARLAWIAASVWIALSVGWLVRAEVPVYAVSDEARLEAEQRPHRLAAALSGLVVEVHGELGDVVRRGQVLVRLDDREIRARLGEARARRDAALGFIAALDARRGSQSVRSEQVARSGTSSTDEGRFRVHQAEAALRDAEAEVARLRPLVEQGILGRAELERAAGRVEQLRPATEAQGAAAERRRSEAGVEQAEVQAELASIDAELVRERGLVATLEAQIEGLEHAAAQHEITAPVDGVLGNLLDLRPGDVVEAGDVLGSVVPDGALRVVAEVSPSVAAGRIRVGQRAVVTFDGFPWTQDGNLHATVTQVGLEPGSGRIRVVLSPRPDPSSPIPLQHGLPGRVEVEVERARPVELILRSARRGVAGDGGVERP